MALSLIRRGVPLPRGSGIAPYWQRVFDTQPANLIGFWRMNETTGTNAADSSGNGYDGTYVGPTVGALTGPDSEPAPSFDGNNDTVTLNVAGLKAAFGGPEGTLLMWLKVRDVSVWTDSTTRILFDARSLGPTNFVKIQRKSSNNNMLFAYRSGSVDKELTLTGKSDTDWVSMGATWSEGSDEIRVYWNGVQEGATLTGLGVWGAQPDEITIGGRAGATVWDGGLALVPLWDAALSPAKMLSIGVI